MGTIISCKNVTKQFSDQKVLEDLNFDIQNGEILGITGFNGAGKTTFLKILIGAEKYDRGEISYFLKDKFISLQELKKMPEIFYRIFGFSNQDGSFYEKLSVEENLELYASLSHLSEEQANENIQKLLKFTGLENKKDAIAETLSSGMQKRLDIACSLVHNPRVLFLDEPTAHLDPHNRATLWRLIGEINKQGKTIVITSHFLGELRNTCHRIAMVHNKKMVIHHAKDKQTN